MSKKAVLVCLVLAVVVVCVGSLFADYGDVAIERSLERLIGWVTKVIGGTMVVVGCIIVGVRMSMGDEQAFKKGALVIVGGLIIFLATNILNLIKGFVGG